jgi:hypothetical protein
MGRCKGSKNKNPYPKSELVLQRLEKSTRLLRDKYNGLGIDNPFYGKHHTDEWKKTRSLLYSNGNAPACGTKRTEKIKEKYRKTCLIRYGVGHPSKALEVRQRMSEARHVLFENGMKPTGGFHTNMKGLFQPKFPEKLDHDPKIIRWASEEFFIPYISPIDKQPHRYFIDLFYEEHMEDGTILRTICEIKPLSQTYPPIPPKKNTASTKRRFLKESATYAVNKAKWESAQKWADKRGYKFQIMTERELKIPAYRP